MGEARGGGMRRREKESEGNGMGGKKITPAGKPHVFAYFASVSGREILIG